MYDNASDERASMNQEDMLDTGDRKTLAEFVTEAQLQIWQGKLKIKTYRKVAKRLLFNLGVTLNQLQADMDYCITPYSILIENGEIINGKIHSDISMILLGTNSDPLSPNKSLEPPPNIDINPANISSFGLIIYYCFIGDYIIEEKHKEAYSAAINGKLKKYLAMNALIKCITPKIFDLLNCLLNMNAAHKLNSRTVLEHKYFKDLLNKCGKIKQSVTKEKNEDVLIVSEVQQTMEQASFTDVFATN